MSELRNPFASPPEAFDSSPLVEHFFRHEFGRIVSALTAKYGWQHAQLVEDAVQTALVDALVHWRQGPLPQQPAAWIRRAAQNRLIDSLRRRNRQKDWTDDSLSGTGDEQGAIDDCDWMVDSDLDDPVLGMMFACCHPALQSEDRVALTLKSLCGFGIKEISAGLLLPTDTVKKRIQRARSRLAEEGVSLEIPPAHDLPQRLNDVHQVLYLMFNEGYCSQTDARWIREDLCEEAARLCHLLTCHPDCNLPDTQALLGLMLLHAARLPARMDDQGLILLLEQQDRTRWDWSLIGAGLKYLDQASQQKSNSRFQLEAAIAYFHCRAKSFAETDWHSIYQLYELLYQQHRSPLYRLNQAIAASYLFGPEAGLEMIAELGKHPRMRRYHWLTATEGELFRRQKKWRRAAESFRRALALCQAPAERELLESRIRESEEKEEG